VEPLAAVFVDLADTTAERQARLLADAALPAGAGGAMAEATRATAPPNFPLFLDAVAALGLSRLHSVPVVHCAHAYAAVLEEAPPAGAGPGWKVVYSGDTRPCDSLVEAARGASLLVHEATFEDALEEEAVAKRHSLTREAVATGARAGAFRTLLTHFSQRYPKTPVIDASFEESTAIAFDSMALNLADLAALPSMLPALRALFPGGREEEEEAPEEGW
jgi:ribonuclease Z